MKRGLEINLVEDTSVKSTHKVDLPKDIIFYITKFIDAPECIDIKTYFYWHATCRYLWQEYTQITPENVHSKVIEPKYRYIETHYKNSLFYYHDYCSSLMGMAFHIQQMNGKLRDKLVPVREKKKKIIEKTAPWDQVRQTIELCELDDVQGVLKFDKGKSWYGCYILRQSIQWIKTRYGWDLRVAKKDNQDYLTLLPIKWTESLGTTSLKLVLVACDNKYH